MKIRKATIADLNGIRLIYNHSIEHTTSVYHYEQFSEKQMEEWYSQKLQNDFPVFVAVEEHEIIGFVSYGTFRPWPGFIDTVEHSVHIHPNHQGKGVAFALMENIIIAAVDQQKHVMVAGVDASNKASIHLHEKLGFQMAGTLNEVGKKFGKRLDLTFMQLMLPTNKSNA